MDKIKVIIVDDNRQFRESVKDLLTNKYDCEVIAEAGNGKEFLELPKDLNPDIILMDLSMPVIDGLAATKNYFWDFPHSKIIAVTNHTEMAYLLQMLQVGFKGCIFKNNIFNEVQQAMMAVLDDKLWFPEHLQFDMKLGH